MDSQTADKGKRGDDIIVAMNVINLNTIHYLAESKAS